MNKKYPQMVINHFYIMHMKKMVKMEITTSMIQKVISTAL